MAPSKNTFQKISAFQNTESESEKKFVPCKVYSAIIHIAIYPHNAIKT